MGSSTVDFDVVIIGAGLSGLGAAVHLSNDCPELSFAILEARDTLGGTWDLFRYPGVRSDSDMHTLGYRFKPWTQETSIAEGSAILDYLRETAAENNLEQHIRFGHQVERADWSSDSATWALQVRVGPQPADHVSIRCRFLSVCAGYYDYANGHQPEFVGTERFGGLIVHPQHWPEDLDYGGSTIAVVGSGATAITLVPALAQAAEHVTMVQRSPTYVVAQPAVRRWKATLDRALPNRFARSLTRRGYIWRDQVIFRVARTFPKTFRRVLVGRVRSAIGDEQTQAHFSPEYDPWDERLCLIPNGDLFEAMNSGSASVVTGSIDRLVPDGLVMASGESIRADIIVTATGLELVMLGGMHVVVDGRPIDFADCYTYRGVAYSGVPNLVSTFGYVNASWTLRADLVSRYTCRLLTHMRETGADTVVPTLRPEDNAMGSRAFIDDFSPGYIARAENRLPRQGSREPWVNFQRYRPDRRSLLRAPIDDGVMQFRRSPR